MDFLSKAPTGLPMPGQDFIPSGSAHVETSGLKSTVETGEQTCDINLESEASK